MSSSRPRKKQSAKETDKKTRKTSDLRKAPASSKTGKELETVKEKSKVERDHSEKDAKGVAANPAKDKAGGKKRKRSESGSDKSGRSPVKANAKDNKKKDKKVDVGEPKRSGTRGLQKKLDS